MKSGHRGKKLGSALCPCQPVGRWLGTRAPLAPGETRAPGRADLGALDIPRHNELHLRLGWSAFRSRRGSDIGMLAPGLFRALTEETVKSAVAGH